MPINASASSRTVVFVAADIETSCNCLSKLDGEWVKKGCWSY